MLNEVRLLGNLAKEPETGKAKAMAITKFVVISNGRTDSQKAVLPVTVFGKAAEFAAGLTKGSQVLVIGRLQTDRWQDKAGQNQYKTSVIASLVIPVSKERR